MESAEVVVGFSVNPEISLGYRTAGGWKHPVTQRQETISGTSVDVALWLQEFGVATSLIAGVGQDGLFTGMLREFVRRSGMPALLLPIRERTSLAVVARDQETGRVLHFSDKTPYLQGVEWEARRKVREHLETLTPAFLLATGVMPEDVFLVEALFQNEGRKSVTRRVLNPRAALLRKEYRDTLGRILAGTDLVILNHEELSSFAGEVLDGPPSIQASVGGLHDLGPKIVIVTCAERGAYLFQRGEAFQHQPTILVGPIEDETGAGDAFLAGLVIALSSGWTLEEAMPFSALLSGFAMTKVGGASITSRAVVEQAWRERCPKGKELRRDCAIV